ncbi:hypothetical protein ONS95_002674 [Cadophora gregata]|uniref:uncharacterized protein n=1 Tax=Cadophora gregata TaxID=51156 RepID=UPI0026DBEBD9|nr:uncharacterized protein ONS95_002674 [Cadophora gregata]KAK0110012.1 hypothetical protein ONS95_002674 [Cadophora gregata]KAK0110366.1 hypothetical protein ONS96_001981 [Cadophora gregata f. sp. sojae]
MVYHSPYSTPDDTPLAPTVVDASTPWSDVLLEDLRTTIQFNPPTQLIRKYGYGSHKTRLRSWGKVVWLCVFLVAGLWWAFLRRQDGRYRDNTKMVLDIPTLDRLQFIDASHPYIRVDSFSSTANLQPRLTILQFVGRWLATADGTHKDGSFPGVYFDFAVNGSSTVLISLHNSEQQTQSSAKESTNISPTLPFLPLTNTTHAAPISLLVRIDDDEYLIFPNATSLISICRGNLNPPSRHEIRIIAPMVGGDAVETLQIKGIWIDEGGQLLPFQDAPTATNQFPQQAKSTIKRRMLEIVTDLPGFNPSGDKQKTSGSSRGILGGVMGWEYLLGEMFGSDHVTIGNDGMCLIQDCLGGRGSPAGLADVFFQSGPAGSEQYTHPWFFQDYTSDVIVMNIGTSDWDSFQTHTQEYNKTLWELSVTFEETYITMIQAIRALAYPKYSAATMDSSRYIYSAQNAAAGVPIFIMRPFRGQLEQATHAVVDRLRTDGDKNVFWLDTSGWLNTEVDFDGRPEDQHFFLDEESSNKQWRLTERGHQRVAILLHNHVCRYLAREVDKCAFLPPEIYLGKALDHDAIRLNDFLEDEKEKKLKKLFWI